MANYYVGTGSSYFTTEDDVTIRSGFNKKAGDTALGSKSTGADVKSGSNASGSAWGSFTGCGGLIAKTATQVFVLHSAPGGALLSSQWKSTTDWLGKNKDLITQLVFINFGNNANPPIVKTITDYLGSRAATETVPKVQVQVIQRNGNKAIKVSANLTGVEVLSGPRQDSIYSKGWDSVSSGSTTQPS